MSAPGSRKRVRSSFSSEDGSDGMLPEDSSSVPNSTAAQGSQAANASADSNEHSTRKAMRIQKTDARCSMSPSARGSSNSSGTSPYQGDGVMTGYGGQEGQEFEGEYVPNSDVDPVFLRKIKTNPNLSTSDKEVVRLIGQHLFDLGLKTASDVLMKEAGCKLDDPSSATFRKTNKQMDHICSDATPLIWREQLKSA